MTIQTPKPPKEDEKPKPPPKPPTTGDGLGNVLVP